MGEIKFSTTAHMSIEQIAEAIRAVWAKVEYDDSDEPEEVETTESYARYCRINNIDLAHSVIARDGEGDVMGIAMLGVRGERGWCGDFGVVPQWRGRGVGHRLMAAFVEQARLLGLRSLQLEVRQDNVPAIKIYEKAGYRIRGSFFELIATRRELRLDDPSSPSHLVVVSCDPLEVLRWYGEPFSHVPTWEHELPSLLALDHTRAWVSRQGKRDRAFILYEPQGSHIYATVLHLGTTPEATADDLRALLAAALANDPAASQVVFAGVPEGSRIIDWLKSLGFSRVVRLHEMALKPLHGAEG